MYSKRVLPLTGTAIVHDYYFNWQKLQSRFAEEPGLSGCLRQAPRINKSLHHRQKLSSCLVTYNRQLGAGEKALANAQLLERENCLAVVTGQQTGLFTGPALTVYKAMTAVALAQQLTEELSQPVVPVFWMASEDHDYPEVNRLYVITAKRRRRLLSLNHVPRGRPSVGCISLTGIDEFLNRVAAAVPDDDFNKKLLAEHRSMMHESRSICQWFARCMLKLFDDYGLVMLDPMLPELRQLAAPVIRRAIVESPKVQEEVAAGGQKLAALGYEPVIIKEPGHMHLFYYHGGDRLPLHLNDCQVTTRRGLASWSTSLKELAALNETAPEKFSPGVALRPVVQDYLLPTVAFVAGPGEINYLAQLKEVYRGCGVPMPPVYPRAQLTVLGSREREVLDMLQADENWLHRGLDGYLASYLNERDHLGVRDLVAGTRQEMYSQYRNLLEQLRQVDTKLETTGINRWNRIAGHLEYLQKKAWQSFKKQHQGFIREVKAVQDVLLPGGNSQESTYSFYSLLFYYGEDLLRVFDRVDFTDAWVHQLFYVD